MIFNMYSDKQAVRGMFKQMLGVTGSKNDPEVLTAQKESLLKMNKTMKMVGWMIIGLAIPLCFIFIGFALLPLGWFFLRNNKKSKQNIEEAYAELLAEMTAQPSH